MFKKEIDTKSNVVIIDGNMVIEEQKTITENKSLFGIKYFTRKQTHTVDYDDRRENEEVKRIGFHKT